MNKRILIISILLTTLLLFSFASLANAAVYTYDEIGRLTSVTYDTSQTISYGHDPGGNVLSAPSTVFTIQDDFSFETAMWTYSGSAYRDAANGYVVLTPNAAGKTGNIWLKNEILSPFTAEFKYKAGGGTGADGMVFSFYKNKNYTPGGGGYLGFNDSSGQPVTGYGIEFDNYRGSLDPSTNHIALIKDTVDSHLISAADARTEDNQWHTVKVTVDYTSVVVTVDSQTVLNWTGNIDLQHAGFGFSGATGGSYNWHIVDDIKIEVPASYSGLPKVTSTDPQDDATNIAVNQQITINFNETILKGSNFSNISLMKDSTPVEFVNSLSGSQLVLAPLADLDLNSTYTVTIPAAAVRDYSNKSLAGAYTFSFTTEQDTTAPAIAGTDPLGSEIIVNFSEEIYQSTNFANITFKKGSTDENFTTVLTGKKLKILPVNPLDNGFAYTVNIPLGAVKDLAQNDLADDYVYTFTAAPTWSKIDDTENDWQQGTLDKVSATAAGDLELQKQDDQFSDSVLSADWTWDVPKSGPTYSLTELPGWFRLTVPNTTTFDHWSTVNNAPKLRRSVSSGDWTAEMKYDLSTYTSGANFHAALLVYFGPYEAYYWGPFKGTGLDLEKTGVGLLAHADYFSKSGFLRVRKAGTTYYFDYRENAIDPWVNAGTHVSANVPQSIGVGVKTWSNTAVVMDTDSFILRYAEGSRTSPVLDISSVGTADQAKIRWDATVPQGSELILETNVSLDVGSTWQGWQAVTNGGDVSGITTGTNLSNGRIMYRATMNAEEVYIIPQMHNLTMYITTLD